MLSSSSGTEEGREGIACDGYTGRVTRVTILPPRIMVSWLVTTEFEKLSWYNALHGARNSFQCLLCDLVRGPLRSKLQTKQKPHAPHLPSFDPHSP
uniref:Uncharacterized protein n=1 Tax=Rhipicephalus zambeziensis TaxID=60191 RepID=A0A224YGU2_9ACAR